MLSRSNTSSHFNEHLERSLPLPQAVGDVETSGNLNRPDQGTNDKTANMNKPDDLTSLIAHKISELEKDASRDEEEEREISRAVKAEHKKLFNLVSETDTELGKITLLHKKYSLLYSDMQKLERDYARQRVKLDKTVKESNSSKQELNKALTMKNKLETLCRELQKENKRVKEDSKKLAQSEQQKRAELNSKFETTIFDIKNKINVETVLTGKRLPESSLLRDKFKSFLEQYDLRDRHYAASLRAKELESQLHQARVDRFQRVADAEAQKARALHTQVSTFGDTENELRSQLNIYVEKFKQVEDTLNNSNDLFLNFRKEMETMTKKTKKLEKENSSIRSKCDTANKNILEMAEERASYRKDIERLQQKSAKLESLCRALQAERHKGNSMDSQERQSSSAHEEEIPDRISALNGQESDLAPDDDYSEASFELHEEYSARTPPSNSPPPVPIVNDGYDALRWRDQDHQVVPAEMHRSVYPRSQENPSSVRSISSEHHTPAAVTTKTSQNRPLDIPGRTKLKQDQQHFAEDIAEVAGRFSLFQKIFSSIPTRVGSSNDHGALADIHDLTVEERRLYDQACQKLSSMTARFQDQHNFNAVNGDSHEAATKATQLASAASDRARQAELQAQQFEFLKRQIPADKLKEFTQQYDTMIKACTSLVQSPETLDQTYEALMTSMAILLSEGDLANLQKKWIHNRETQAARKDSR